MPDRVGRLAWPAAAFGLLLVALAVLRPVDHDESQYVAAARLTASGLLPYRDYPYLQTPLQPFLFAPLAGMAGDWGWPALRILNALLGWTTVLAVAAAARRAGASTPMAIAAAGLFAATDIFLFSVGTARNDALPAALLAVALWLVVRGEPHASRRGAALVGFLLAAAAAAKLSYALPAAAYGLAALVDRRRRPLHLALGALPVLALIGWTAWASPGGFVFGVLRFPVVAPAEYYAAIGKPWKLTTATRTVDALKFLALGPALLACVAVLADRARRRPAALDALILAGALAAILPSPTWRQYWLPMLPPLFVALALAWTRRAPGRAVRIAAAVFAAAGLAPTLAALAGEGTGLVRAMREARAIGHVVPPGTIVATLSPQFLPAHAAIDPRFATGPFYFRSRGLVSGDRAQGLHLFARTAPASATLPDAVLVGGEGRWTGGDDALDQLLADRAARAGYRPTPVAGTRFTLWSRP